MSIVRWSLLVFVSGLLGLSQPSPATAADVFRNHSRSNAGSVSWSDDEGSGFTGFVLFNEGSSVTGQDAFVTYFIARTSDQEVVEFGFGSIPREHVSGSGKAVMYIDTDTSAAANPRFTRLAGQGGPITIQVRKTSDFYRRTAGTQQLRLGASRLNSNGSETTVSAAATGFAIVGPVQGLTTAELATNRTTTIELITDVP